MISVVLLSNYNRLMKAIKTRAYVDRLKGHKDTIICLHSPFDFNGGILYSIAVDGGFRGNPFLSSLSFITILTIIIIYQIVILFLQEWDLMQRGVN